MGGKRWNRKRRRKRRLAAVKNNANREHLEGPKKSIGLDTSDHKYAPPVGSALSSDSLKPQTSKPRGMWLKSTVNDLLWASISAIICVALGFFGAPLLARAFSKQPTLSYMVSVENSENPHCSYMKISLRPPHEPLKSLFFELHFPAEAHSVAVLSGEDPSHGGENDIFITSNNKIQLAAPCNITNLGPSDPPPNLRVTLLSDQRNLVIRGNDVDVHSTVTIWVGLYPFTPETTNSPGFTAWHASVNARATYLAYGQEIPAKVMSDRPWSYSLHRIR